MSRKWWSNWHKSNDQLGDRPNHDIRKLAMNRLHDQTWRETSFRLSVHNDNLFKFTSNCIAWLASKHHPINILQPKPQQKSYPKCLKDLAWRKVWKMLTTTATGSLPQTNTRTAFVCRDKSWQVACHNLLISPNFQLNAWQVIVMRRKQLCICKMSGFLASSGDEIVLIKLMGWNKSREQTNFNCSCLSRNTFLHLLQQRNSSPRILMQVMQWTVWWSKRTATITTIRLMFLINIQLDHLIAEHSKLVRVPIFLHCRGA